LTFQRQSTMPAVLDDAARSVRPSSPDMLQDMDIVSPPSVLELQDVARSPSPSDQLKLKASGSPPRKHKRNSSAPISLPLFDIRQLVSSHMSEELWPTSPAKRALEQQQSELNFADSLKQRLHVGDLSDRNNWRHDQRVAVAVQSRRLARGTSKLARPPQPSQLSIAKALHQKLGQGEEVSSLHADRGRALARALQLREKRKVPSPLSASPLTSR